MDAEPIAAKTNMPALTKVPPMERPEASRLRTTVIFSFWAMILLFGLPMWWRTTSIPRARLPLQQMVQWSEGQIHQPVLPLQIWISAPGMTCGEARQMVQNTQHSLDDMNEFPAVHLRLRLVPSMKPLSSQASAGEDCSVEPVPPGGPEPALDVELNLRDGDISFEMSRTTSKCRFNYPTTQQASLPNIIADWLRSIFLDEQLSVAYRFATLSAGNGHAQAFLKSASPDVMSEIVHRDTRAFKTSPCYHLTFSLFTAGGSPSVWSIQAALRAHIQPLLASLSATSNFTITTQVQLYSAFSSAIPLYKVEGRNGTFLKEEDLSAFVNAAEWPLSPSIGEGPTINFILYVPSRDQIPLTLLEDKGNSWLIPQWGGITILNPPLVTHPETGLKTVTDLLDEEELRPAFETFSSQLLSLLGVPASSSQGHLLPLPLRLQTQKRLAALSMYFRASSTLGSLARLARHLDNIPIPKRVASLTDDTLANLASSAQSFRDSAWDNAIQQATKAFEDSEKAFFDKAMVGQVYFPDEHKVAVYLPLLGPIGVPLFVGLIREAKRFVTAIRTTQSTS